MSRPVLALAASGIAGGVGTLLIALLDPEPGVWMVLGASAALAVSLVILELLDALEDARCSQERIEGMVVGEDWP